MRLGHLADVVDRSWWTHRRCHAVAGTPDPELYRYGVHGRDFTYYFTVGPGAYHVRIKLAETRNTAPRLRALAVEINGDELVTDMDIAGTAGGLRRATDLVFNNVEPRDGIIAVRFRNRWILGTQV